MAKAKKISFDAKIRKVEDVHRRKEDEEKDIQRMLARDEDGVIQIQLTAPNGNLDGMIPGAIVKVTVSQDQTTIEDHAE